jgi:cytochrome c
MTNSNIVWSEATLDAFLAAPQKNVRGNRMAFVGLSKPQERAEVIAFLATK